MKLTCAINDETLQDMISVETGLYHPLRGFMSSEDYESVVNRMRLADNSVWTLPITVDVNHKVFKKALDNKRIYFISNKKEIGFMDIHDCFKVDQVEDAGLVYKTKSAEHPGVRKELSRSAYRLGGVTKVTDRSILRNALDPKKTKKLFKNRGWKTVVGFQTRNPIHASHEYLQRIGLDICDGLFVNPSIGWKKSGDFSEEAVMAAYKCMIKEYYPQNRVHLEGLKVYFRYAGPREAIFHAILRKNLGCTHFIIGRDHAGVGNYYGTYEAHELAEKITSESDLGIRLLLIKEPYLCGKCGGIVTEKHCRHKGKDIEKISGSMIRDAIKNNRPIDGKIMRPEVVAAIKKAGGRIFIP